jgi:Chs5-Arf1p-binding protein BUD7/BCH1
MDTFRDVPEFFEVELGESLIARTEILGELSSLFLLEMSHLILLSYFP